MQINHKEYSQKVKTMTLEELFFAANDAYQAIMALPAGGKVGNYADEINYCAGEINARLAAALKGMTSKNGFDKLFKSAFNKMSFYLERGCTAFEAIEAAKEESCAGPAVWEAIRKHFGIEG